MLKVHYHSDCLFFAGCENMLAIFFNSEDFRKNHRISFSYQQSALYTQGFKQKVNCDFPVYPVSFPDLSDPNKLPSGLSLLSKRLIMLLLRLFFNGLVFICEVTVLFRLFRKLNPDILHINNGGYPAALSARAAAVAGKLAGVPKVLMVVNNMADGYQRLSRWFNYPVDRMVVCSVDRFVTGSEAAAARLRSVLNLPEHKVIPVHNGIEIRSPMVGLTATRERLGLESFDGVIFGVVALLVPRKGHRVLLESILKLVEENRLKDQELIILIEGHGPLEQMLIDFIHDHNITRWVRCVGDEENVIDFMSILDVLILPSVREEDFPNVILEVMALGKPVIASHLAGTPEQVDEGVTGLLVEPGNVTQLGDAICYLMDHPNVRHDMGSAAAVRFNTYFTSKIALSHYSNMYTELFNSRV